MAKIGKKDNGKSTKMSQKLRSNEISHMKKKMKVQNRKMGNTNMTYRLRCLDLVSKNTQWSHKILYPTAYI